MPVHFIEVNGGLVIVAALSIKLFSTVKGPLGALSSLGRVVSVLVDKLANRV